MTLLLLLLLTGVLVVLTADLAIKVGQPPSFGAKLRHLPLLHS